MASLKVVIDMSARELEVLRRLIGSLPANKGAGCEDLIQTVADMDGDDHETLERLYEALTALQR